MAAHEPRIRENPSSLDIPLHVQARARRTELSGFHNGALKLKVQAPPVDDAANKAIVRYFSKLLEIPRSRLAITSGAKSRDKILRIEGISLTHFLQSVAPEIPRGRTESTSS